MHTRRALRVATAVVSLAMPALAGTVLAAPAAHAAPSPWQSYSYVSSDTQFHRMGHVAGQPGNAHSGYFSFDTSDDPTAVVIYDWTCPSGVEPPFSSVEATACTLVQTAGADASQSADTAHAMPTFTGPLSATQDIVVPFTNDSGASTEGHIDVAWGRTGPLQRTVVDQSTTDEDSFLVHLTAPMAVSGSVGWVNLNDPRNHATVSNYFRDTLYFRTHNAG